MYHNGPISFPIFSKTKGGQDLYVSCTSAWVQFVEISCAPARVHIVSHLISLSAEQAPLLGTRSAFWPKPPVLRLSSKHLVTLVCIVSYSVRSLQVPPKLLSEPREQVSSTAQTIMFIHCKRSACSILDLEVEIWWGAHARSSSSTQVLNLRAEPLLAYLKELKQWARG